MEGFHECRLAPIANTTPSTTPAQATPMNAIPVETTIGADGELHLTELPCWRDEPHDRP